MLPGGKRVGLQLSIALENQPLSMAILSEERWFLALGSKIVGVQHYDGVVSDRENAPQQRLSMLAPSSSGVL